MQSHDHRLFGAADFRKVHPSKLVVNKLLFGKPRAVMLVVIAVFACQPANAETPLPTFEAISDGHCDAQTQSHSHRSLLWGNCGCRIDPTGDLTTRMPYQSVQRYYYRRPYQSTHVIEHSADAEFSPRSLPYANDAFQSVYAAAEQQAMEQWASGSAAADRDDVVMRDKPLEYVDWKEHRDARRKWDLESGVNLLTDLPTSDLPTSELQTSSRRTHRPATR